MMELKLSQKPLMKNPSCASCGKVFREKGVNLQIEVDHKSIHFPICQPCFDLIPLFEATVNLEQGFARVKR
jgi:hypothetical protein